MTVLAVPATGQTLSPVQMAYEVLQSTDVPWLINQATKAKQIAAALKATDAAIEQTRAAVKYEAFCLRRLAQLGAETNLPHERAEIARKLAHLSDTEVEEWVDQCPQNVTGCVAVSRWLSRQEVNRLRWERADDIRTQGLDAMRLGRSSSSITFAARMLLQEAAGEMFTVTDLGRDLYDLIFDADPDDDPDPELADALNEVVRYAIRHDDGFTEGAPDGLPEIITVRYEVDGVERWARKPWHRCTVGELRWMVAYRREQAAEMQAAADRLAEAAQPFAHNDDKYSLRAAVQRTVKKAQGSES